MIEGARRGRGRLTIALGLAFAVEGALYSAVTPILPLLSRRFSLSGSAAGLLLSGYSAGLVIGALIAVPVLRVMNARQVAVAGLFVLASTTVLFAWGEDGAVLIGARLAGGTAAGIMWTACVTWLIGAWPKERRGAALGTSMSFAVVGTLAGPVIGTSAVQFGVRLPYTAVAALCVAAAVWIATLARPAAVRVDDHHVARVPAGSRTPAVLAGGLVALTGAVIGLVNVAAPLVLTRLGASDFYGGVVFLIAAVLSVGTGRPLGAAVDRFGTRPALALGLLGLAVLTPLLGAGFPVQAAAAVVIALLVWNNLCYVSLATMLTRSGEAAGWSLRFATALLATVWGTGETVGAVLAGLGLDSLGSGWTTAVAGASVAVGLVVFAWMTAGGSGRRAEPENLPATGAART